MKKILLGFLFLFSCSIFSKAQCDLSGVVLTSVLPDPNSTTNNFDTDGDGTAETDMNLSKYVTPQVLQ